MSFSISKGDGIAGFLSADYKNLLVPADPPLFTNLYERVCNKDQLKLIHWVRGAVIESFGVDLSDFCLIGLEGNRAFSTRLKEVTEQSPNAIAFAGVVSHVFNGNTTFFIDKKTAQSHESWGNIK